MGGRESHCAPARVLTHAHLHAPGAVSSFATRVASEGRAWISAGMLSEGPVLRACITHDECSFAHVDALCEALGRALAAGN